MYACVNGFRGSLGVDGTGDMGTFHVWFADGCTLSQNKEMIKIKNKISYEKICADTVIFQNVVFAIEHKKKTAGD